MARKPAPKKQEERAARRFLLEFLSVTLGVLLALALEQAAAEWRERRRVADTRASMDKEIGDFAEIFRLRMRVDKCIERKLVALEAHLDGRPAAGPVRNVGRTPFFFSSRGAWNSDASGLLARHLGADTFQRYGEIYQGMEEYDRLSGDEQNVWVTLQTLEGDRDAISSDRRAQLREAVARARNTRLLQAAIAEQMLAQARALGVAPNGSLAGVKVEAQKICLPL